MERIETLQEVKENHILRVLRHFNGNRSKTAQALGVSVRGLRNTLKILKEAGLPVPAPEHKQSKGKLL